MYIYCDACMNHTRSRNNISWQTFVILFCIMSHWSVYWSQYSIPQKYDTLSRLFYQTQLVERGPSIMFSMKLETKLNYGVGASVNSKCSLSRVSLKRRYFTLKIIMAKQWYYKYIKVQCCINIKKTLPSVWLIFQYTTIQKTKRLGSFFPGIFYSRITYWHMTHCT